MTALGAKVERVIINDLNLDSIDYYNYYGYNGSKYGEYYAEDAKD